MFKITFYRFKIIFVAFLTAAGLLFVPAVFAQNESAPAGAAADIPENLLPLAKELNCSSMAACAASFTANFSRGMELAEQLDVYNKEQKALAKSFKTEVLTKLAEVSEEDFDQKIIEIAKNIAKNKPTLARQFDITSVEVKAAETIVAEVKKAGVNLTACSRPAETLAREELIACLNASRNLAERADEVKTYIPKNVLVAANNALTLEEALKRGEYNNLGVTADEVGMNCLRSGSLALCDEIAGRFFGAEGVEMLQKARNQVGQTKEYYKNVGNVALTTADGQTIAGKDAIKRACDNAIKNKDVAMARVCGDFAVKNGFAKQEEVDKGIKILQSVAEKGADLDYCAQDSTACETYIPEEFRQEFDAMREIDRMMREEMGFDPRECEKGASNPEIGRKCLEGSKKVLPKLESLASQFPEARRIAEEIKFHIARGEAMEKQKNQIEAQFQNAGGPGGCRNQEECFKFCSDPQHGPECLSFGAKYGYFGKAETAQRLEAYTQRLSAPALLPSQNMMQYPGAMTQTQQSMGMYQQPTNYMQPGIQYPTMAPGTLPGMQGMGGPNPECFAAIQSGDFAKAKEVCAMSVYAQPTMPQLSPTMPMQPLQQGQTQPQYPQQQYPQQYCPQNFPAPCPSGQYREMQMNNGCPVFGACVQDQGMIVQPSQQPQPCMTMALPPCPAGQYHPTNSTGCPKPECISSVPATCIGGQTWCPSPGGSGGWCQIPPCPSMVMPSPPATCPSGQYWYVPVGGGAGYCRSTTDTSGSCSGSQVWCPGQNGQPGWCQTPPCPTASAQTPSSNWVRHTWTFKDGVSESSYILNRTDQDYLKFISGIDAQCRLINKSQFFWKSGAGNDASENWQNFGIPDCFGQTSTTVPVACTGGQVSCTGVSGISWCQAPPCPATSISPQSCSGGQIWCPDSSGLGGWCQMAPCPPPPSTTGGMSQCTAAGGVWCGTYCKSEPGPCPGTGTCPMGQYWYVPSGGGAGYCRSTSDTTSCTGGQIWCSGPSGTWCQMPPCPSLSGSTSTYPASGTCSSGQYWYVPPAGGAGYCKMSETISTSCSGGQVWCSGSSGIGGWCQMSPCPSSTTMPGSCPNAGDVWCANSTGGGFCQPPPCQSTCPSGQYWYVPVGGGAGYCRSTTDTSGSCSGSQVWCPGQNGQPGWCQTPPCPTAMTCTSAGGDCCSGSSADPDCGMSSSCTGGQVWCTSVTGGPGWCQMSPCPSTTSPQSCSGGQIWCPDSSGLGGWCQMAPCPPAYPSSTSCSSGQYWYVPSGGGAGYCRQSESSIPSPSSCSSDQVWCANASGTGGWCQMAPCPSSTPPPTSPPPGGMTCTPAGGDCCSGAPADPDCGSVPPPPTTPSPTEPPPPTTPPPPPPSEPPPPPPPTEPLPPTSTLPIRSALANALEQLSAMLQSLLQSVSR